MRILFALLCTIALACGAATEFEARRVQSQNTALTLYPEVADPRSRIGAEVERLVAEFEASKDEVLFRDDAPLVITQRAAERVVGSITVEESEKDALRLFPDLALVDSPLKKLFSERQEALRKANSPTAFKNPRWPVLLAFECAVALDPARLPGATPPADKTPPDPTAAPSLPELPTPANPDVTADKTPANATQSTNPAPPANPPATPNAAPPPANAAAPGNPVAPAGTPAVAAPKPLRTRKPALIGAGHPPAIGEQPPAGPPGENPNPADAEKRPKDAEVRRAPDPDSVEAVAAPKPAPPEPVAETPAIQEIDPIPKKAAPRKTGKTFWTKARTQAGPYITGALALASLIVFVTWLKRQRV